LIPAIIRHGFEKINGNVALGYPGLWSMENKEVRKIEKLLS